MLKFPRYYTRLFNGVTDAIEALLLDRPEYALELLIDTQQEAEEMFIADGGDEAEIEED